MENRILIALKINTLQKFGINERALVIKNFLLFSFSNL